MPDFLKKSLRFLPFLLPVLLAFPFCQKEKFTFDPADKLAFSVDTLRFDTVFTELGSATRILKIYNRHDRSIRISRIYLERGDQSRFNLNIDGIAGDDQSGLEIAPNDSMYVFAEVTIDPDQPLSVSPFVLAERLIFETNGNSQAVILEAWGQNANYIPSRFYADSIVAFGCNGGEWVWDDPKPYVIYGVLIVDECTLRIPAGAHVYVHGGLAKQVIDSAVYTYNDGFLAFQGSGKLLVEGTKDRPVIFESDRLEPEFDEESGQWTGIWLQAGTRGHRIEHCIVRNSIVGVRVDSAADLTIRNSQIYNTASSGLIGIHAKITAENCLFYRNVGYSVQIEYGGDYDFTYCTAASYGVDGEALKLGNALCLDELCQNYRANALRARFRNCILFGSRADQLTLFDRVGNPAQFDYKLENCIVRVKDLLRPDAYPDFFDHCNPCLNLTSADTIFLNPSEDKFRLDTLHSRANGYALPVPGIDLDLDGKARDAVMPDAGCFEIEF
ncbi:MAG: right-handed parallel beta-helix repeat-containing protein [Saprospiraceae bacterium]